jgi:hypothetical protein
MSESRERYTGPKLPQFTWGQLLSGVLERMVLLEDDPNRPECLEGYGYSKWFRTTSGEDMQVVGGVSGELWLICFYRPDDHDNGLYDFSVRYDEGRCHVYPGDSDLPLPPTAVEVLLGTIVTSRPKWQGANYIGPPDSTD